MFRENLLPYWWMLYRHSKVLNQRTDIFRNVEDAFSVKHADFCLNAKSVYLDIGSGSSVVPTFLYQRHHARTYATEMDRVYLDRQKSYMEMLGLSKRDSFVAQREDATRLSFADGSVDFVTAISTCTPACIAGCSAPIANPVAASIASAAAQIFKELFLRVIVKSPLGIHRPARARPRSPRP